jgi:hypothetical protein
MKLGISLILLSFLAFAKTNYDVLKGSMHRNGNLKVSSSIVEDKALIAIDYKINPKRFIPGFLKKYLEGEHVEKLPAGFIYEEAYLELEKDGVMEIDSAYVYHQGRVDYKRYTKCHKVLIKAKNGKSEIIAYYHPQVGDAGWAFIDLTIKKIPVLKTYNLKAKVTE